MIGKGEVIMKIKILGTKYKIKYEKNGYNTTNYVTLDTLFNTKI